MKHLAVILPIVCFFAACQTTSRIAYLTDRSGNFDIYLSDEIGETHQPLTSNPGWDWSPQWNQDQKAIIYNSNDTLKNFSIRMMDDQGRPLPLNTGGLEEYILSPGGRQVLFTESDSNFRYIHLRDVPTGESRQLISTKAYNGRPMWAPNGKTFSFISDRDGNNELYYYDLKSGEATRLTQTAAREKYTSWTPDSRAIVYTATEAGKEYNDIYRVEIATGNIRRITNDTNTYEEIAVSPDGRKIAFHGRRNGQHHIFTLNIDGSGEKQITRVEAYHGEPEWIPGKD